MSKSKEAPAQPIPHQSTSRVVYQSKNTKQLEELIKIGVPVIMAAFHRTIKSVTGEPENQFYDIAQSARPSRTAKMWFTPHGLITEQQGHYKIIPLANVSEMTVL